MEAHSALAAPHTVRRCGVHLQPQTGLYYTPTQRYGNRRILQNPWLANAHRLQVKSDDNHPVTLTVSVSGVVLLFVGLEQSVMCVCVCLTSSSRRPASQVCVLQLVLWIRPMTDISYNPAISQHQGGTAPLPTRPGVTRLWQCTLCFTKQTLSNVIIVQIWYIMYTDYYYVYWY